MSEPKITFDVDMSKETREESKYGKYVNMLDDHQNMKIEFDEVKEAIKVRKSIDMILDRRKLYNVKVIRRKNAIFLIRERNGN